MTSQIRSSPRIYPLILASGLAALSWEVLWQNKSGLALGVSAWGAAVTLAVTMGGMSLGSLISGHLLKNRQIRQPTRIYGAIEILVGLAGLLLGPAFSLVADLDTWAYDLDPASAPVVHTLGIICVLGVPSLCMGATLPVFGLIARQFRTSIAAIYSLNTLGAAAGALIAAFILIPLLGITHTSWLIAFINIAVGIYALTLQVDDAAVRLKPEAPAMPSQLGPHAERLLVTVTGFATFMLEIAWFRSLTSAFKSTTAAFAIMLSCVLIALGCAASLVTLLKKKNVALGSLISWAGILILLITPLVERFDVAPFPANLPYVLIISWFVITLYVIGPPVLLLGLAVPWILDAQKSPRQWGVLYSLNTLAAIAGSLVAAWIALPHIGFAATAWMSGVIVAAAGILTAPKSRRLAWFGIAVASLAIAVLGQSGIGTVRAQGQAYADWGPVTRILDLYEGPEATLSVAQYEKGGRLLVINGASATGQPGPDSSPDSHYMLWMGRLPMLLAADPKDALVICFGTGQTANALRTEDPESLDIVDINAHVFQLAPYFSANDNVLADPRVHTTVMDGRAYIRRTRKNYDVITLEPMPPILAGVNALYAREFYASARAHMNPHGVIAQWLPYHETSPFYMASIARTFMDVFPNSILWVDKLTDTGILLGTNDDDGPPLGTSWPGFARTNTPRDMTEGEVRAAVVLDAAGMRRYTSHGAVITDDNQLLAYGGAVYSGLITAVRSKEKARNWALIEAARDGKP